MKSSRSPQRHGALCALHRRRAPRALTFAALLGLAAGQTARAADYSYTGGGAGTITAPVTGNFSTGFTPNITGATAADDLIFNGVAYTATDDVATPITVNGVRFNNTGAVIVARGAGTSVTLGGTNPFLNFNNNNGALTYALDTTFTTDGYIAKTRNGNLAANTNPISSGALTLNAGTTTKVVVADVGGDGAAELSLTGTISGSGALLFQNNLPLPAANAGNSGIAATGDSSDWGTTLVSGNNASYSGGVTIGGARVVVTNDNALGTGTLNVLGANTPAGAVTQSSGGTLALGNPNYTGAGIVNGIIAGGITLPNPVNLAGAVGGVYGHGIENNSGNNTLSGVVTLTGSPIIQVNNNTTLTMSNSVVEAPTNVGASVTKQGNGTLVMNNASYTGGTTIQLGTVQFNGTLPTTSSISIGTSAATAASALNIGAGTAFPTVASALPKVNGNSTGALDFIANSTEALDFGAIGAINPAAPLSIGSAIPAGVTYTGAISGQFVFLGGGTSAGLLTLPLANQIHDVDATTQTLLTIGPVGANGIVSLANTNSYTLGTSLAGGVLSFVQGGLGTGPVYFGSQLTQDANKGVGTIQFAPGNTEDISSPLVNGTSRIVKTAPAIIDTNGNNVTFANGFDRNGSINAPGYFTKIGLGTLTLLGDNGSATVPLAANPTAASNFFVRQGTLAVSGPTGTFATTGFSDVGQGQGDNGTMVISNGGRVTVNGDFNVADVNGSAGSLIISDAGSTLSVNTLYVGKGGNNAGGTALATSGAVRQTGGVVQPNVAAGEWRVGGGGNTTDGGQNGVGSYDLLGGSLNTGGSAFQVGASGVGQFTASGAGTTFTTSGYPSIGRFGAASYGVVNVANNATFSQTGTNTFMLVGEVGTGILNVSSGGVVNAQNGPSLRVSNQTGAVGIVNLLTGGTINAKAIATFGGTSQFNFHGGTLAAANAPTTAFMTGLTAAYIYAEGGAIDTGANNVTVAQPLLAPNQSGGVQTINVATGGAGYVSSPIIKITGVGFGASAVPVLTNGVLTAITITNPGGGYVSPTVQILGGNPTTPATLGTFTLNTAAPASGAFTKLGTGTLTLTATNTYTGGTFINVGVLAAGSNGALGTGGVTIASAAALTLNAGVTNAIADNALVSINGTGATSGKINLLNTSETVMYLVLNGTYQPPGNYSAASNPSNDPTVSGYFTGSGTLVVTAIPEPGTWALLGLGVVALGVAGYRRRRAA